MKLLALVAAVVVTTGIGGAHLARSAPAVSWYWTPALCKTQLHDFGIRIDDGRVFNISKAFCVGRGGERWCSWSSGRRYRLYRRFFSIVRSYDGAVRSFETYVTGRRNYRVEGIRLIAREPSEAAFASYARRITVPAARVENEKGCGPP